MIFRQILVRIFLTIEVILNLYFLFMYLLFTSKLGLQALLSSSNLFIFLEKCKIKKNTLFCEKNPKCVISRSCDNSSFSCGFDFVHHTCTDVHFILVLEEIVSYFKTSTTSLNAGEFHRSNYSPHNDYTLL